MPTQLSLFSEPESPETARRPIRRRVGLAVGARRTVPAEEAPPLDLFSPAPPEIAPLLLPEATEGAGIEAASDTAQTATLDPEDFDAVDASESEEDESGRVRFDPAVWHLRSESGDFIHILTGEIRDEDEFIFAASATGGDAPMPDEWDLPQESAD